MIYQGSGPWLMLACMLGMHLIANQTQLQARKYCFKAHRRISPA